MGLLTKTCAVIALVLFGLASEHCRLEAFPAFQFLQFCCEGETEPSAPSNCEDAVCGSLESGGYRLEESQVACPAPILVLVISLVDGLVATKPPPLESSPIPEAAPPELLSSWQFSSRAAPSPRAPSFAS
jgi:hypothetical protein